MAAGSPVTSSRSLQLLAWAPPAAPTRHLENYSFFEGSPSPEADEAEAETAAADPYATAVDPYGGVTEVQDDEEYEESEEEGHEPDEIVEPDPEGSVGLEPEAKRRRIGNDLETSGIVELDVDEDAAALGVKECVAEEAEDADEGEDDNLFFVDTGGD